MSKPTMADFDGFSGVDLMQIERERQIQDLGYDAENDDSYGSSGDLVHAGICYALSACADTLPGCNWVAHGIWMWPGSCPDLALTPADKIHRLTAAGALFAAEIDRIQREQREGGAA
jgi:hypothetical protein